ncbi:peroxiredoxin-like family protein [Acuticoccus sp.]|uniref:peroxiredoxin-like family protein n=1 Tax=Acuticoccus sp. TaxID=1904378 RepID=UPI003B52DC8C
MSDLQPLFPRQPVPPLSADLVEGGRWTSSDLKADPFTLVVFYRGLHCPICKTYLGSLEKQLDEFGRRGVDVVVLSSDTAERAEKAKSDWRLPRLTIGHSVSLAEARRWGLYVSTSRGKTSVGVEEPAMFTEPGLFLIRPDGTLYFVTTQSMPFARPRFEDILPAIDFVVEKNYPGRGEVMAMREAEAA